MTIFCLPTSQAALTRTIGSTSRPCYLARAQQQAYGRAAELQPGRLLPRVQAGLIQAALGDTIAAQAGLTEALVVDAEHPAALAGLGATLLASARRAVAQGAPGERKEETVIPAWTVCRFKFASCTAACCSPLKSIHGSPYTPPDTPPCPPPTAVPAGMAAADLARAAEAAARCTAAHGHMHAAWKLQGDVWLAHHAVTPAVSRGASPEAGCDMSHCAPAAAAWRCLHVWRFGLHAVLLSCCFGAAVGSTQLFKPVSGMRCSWQARLDAMAQARRAYAKAMHRQPTIGASWGELDACLMGSTQSDAAPVDE